jgi:hypothetical protein
MSVKMTEDGLFVCQSLHVETNEGGRMSERDEGGGATVIELLLREPEIVAWLEPENPDDGGDDDYEPPRAA